jgi:hypothetical protein
MKKLLLMVLGYIGAFVAGAATAIAALFAVLYGPMSHATERYKVQKEIENEIAKKAKGAAERTKEEILVAHPSDVLASFPTDARARINAIRESAARRAIDQARARSAAHTDGSGAAGNH